MNKVADDSKPWNHVKIGPDVERDMDDPSGALKVNQGVEIRSVELTARNIRVFCRDSLYRRCISRAWVLAECV